MTLTIAPSSSLRFASSHKKEDTHASSSSRQVISANPEDHIELTTTVRKNTPEESARARKNAQELINRHVGSLSPFHVSPSTERMLTTDAPKQLKEFILPITCNPDSSAHNYLESTHPEFNQVLGVLNKRIQRDPDLKKGFGNHPINLNMEIFANPSHTTETIYQGLRNTYGDGLLVRTNQALEHGVEGFQKREAYKNSRFGIDLQKAEGSTSKDLAMVKVNESPAFKLNNLLGQEFTFPPAIKDSPQEQLHNFLREHLGFAENQINYVASEKIDKDGNIHKYRGSHIRQDHPEDQAIIRNWRLKTAARYVENRATHIKTSWGEWIRSVVISSGYSLGVETLLGNTITSIGPGAIFRSKLKNLKDTGTAVPAWWRKLLLGLPDSVYKKCIDSADGGQKLGVVVNGVLAQATAEVPDVALVKTAYKRVEDPSLTGKEALKTVLDEEKGSLAKSVASAFTGTVPEKMKELLWRPTTMAGKFGNWMTGYATNAVSVLSCAYPFFEDGGPQRNQLGVSNAEAFQPETGDLKLMPNQQANLDKAIEAAKEGSAGVKKFFRGGAATDAVTDAKNLVKTVFRKGTPSEGGSFSKFLHKLPTTKLLAASIPVAVGYSLIPSTVNGAVKTFMAEGVAAEAVQSAVSLFQVPLFGPIELLAFNTVAVLNRNHPKFVEGLSKAGRPVLDGVHGIAVGIRSGFGSAYRTFRKAPMPPDTNQVYKKWYEDYKKIKPA